MQIAVLDLKTAVLIVKRLFMLSGMFLPDGDYPEML